MTKIISASFLAVLSLSMLLPVAGQVNATSVNQPIVRQSGNPLPGGGGGHYTGRQSGNPLPGGGGGH